ncbi:MAG: hypothetical protein H0U34_09545 [Sphingomonas sp.]|nr:hypothetical protein [Sphingomonas sp.]
MRELILLGAAAIALSACSPEPSAEERAAAEQNVTSQVVATNDTTAIDAATGEAANMAADVDFMPEVNLESDGNEAAPATARPRNPAPQRRDSDSADEDEPGANSL